MKKQSLAVLALGLVAITSVASQTAEARNHNGWGQSCASGNADANLGVNPYNNPGFYNNNQVYTNQAYGFNRGWGNGNFGWNGFGNGASIDARQAQISNAIQRGIASGRLSQSEANRLLARQQRINDLEARLRVNGLSFGERARLQADLSKLSAQLHFDMNNRRFF